jgi:hypothetical protein
MKFPFPVRLASLIVGLSLPVLSQTLPNGPGKAELERICGTCHGAEAVMGVEKMDRDGWQQKVFQMIGAGEPEDQAAIKMIVDYLVKNMGTTGGSSGAGASAAGARPGASAAAGGKLPDYEFFKAQVEPIFVKKREGQARCILCHSRGSGLRLVDMSPGATTWTEEQSRRNYEAAVRLVIPGNPDASRLLVHTLPPDQGGDPFHGGGRKFLSKQDPDWQVLAAWVKTGSEAPDTIHASQILDFATYRAKVEPVLLNPREGGGAEAGGVPCVSCHTTVITRMRLQPLAEGSTTWTEAQSRRNFEVVSRLVVPGQPGQSMLVLKPLSSSEGGVAEHAGGKYFKSKDDPEYKALVDFINSRRQ